MTSLIALFGIVPIVTFIIAFTALRNYPQVAIRVILVMITVLLIIGTILVLVIW
jgi:hypothetical protein